MFEAFQKSVAFFEPILEHFRSILEIEGILKHFEAFLEAFLERKCQVSPVIQEQSRKFSLHLQFSNQLCGVPFERYIFKWSQLSFLLSFSIGNSKFNPKGDMILFVVCGNLQVQEKLFKILILPKVAIQKLILLCCGSIFMMTNGQL